MKIQFIFAKQSELKAFTQKANRDNKIRRFFRDILHEIPQDLKVEIKQLPTNLLQFTDQQQKVNGANLYKFQAKNASQRLARYLSTFAVYVEADTPDIIEWKENINGQSYAEY